MKIFILGFMGNGKTTIGKRLSEILHYDFIDLDENIEKEEGLSIGEIFYQHGEEYFRQKEKAQLQKLGKVQNAVIAVGGGTPCFYDNMDWMNKQGFTIYLKLSSDEIIQRLALMNEQEIGSRPLIANKSKEELRIFVEEVLKKREPFYKKAKFVLENPMGKMEETIHEILKQLKK